MSGLTPAEIDLLARLDCVLATAPAAAAAPADALHENEAEIARLKALLATKTATKKKAEEEAAAAAIAAKDAEIARLREALATKTATKKRNEEGEAMAAKEAEISRLKEALATKAATKKKAEEDAAAARAMEEEIARLKGQLETKKSTAVKATSTTATSALNTKAREELDRMAKEKQRLMAELDALDTKSKTISAKTTTAPTTAFSTAAHQNAIAKFKDELAKLDAVQTAKKGELAAEAQKYLRRAKALDLVFVMDCTASMGPYIEAAKASVRGVIAAAKELEQGAYVRVAFIGYRDYTAAEHFVILPFVEPTDEAGVARMASEIAAIRPMSNHDEPEDIAGGLKKATEMAWYAGTRVMLLIADAPCHGQRYHTMIDGHPAGDPSGLVPEDLLVELAELNVDLYFGKITEDTNQMINIFNDKLRTIQRSIKTVPISADPKQFLPAVINTMKESWKKSEAYRGTLTKTAAMMASVLI